jgi:dipeptidyl aminopeptidase/acylaminoacyl peptidase
MHYHGLAVLFIFIIQIGSFAQKPLTHEVYDSWGNINSTILSNDGRFVSWEINPQQGDGWLYLYDQKKSSLDSVRRGYNARFSASSKYLVYQIKPTYSSNRKARQDKKKKEDMPKDSLGIWLVDKDTILRYPGIRMFVLPSESSNDWLSIFYAYSEEKPDTGLHKMESGKSKTPKKSKLIKETGKLQFLNPIKNIEKLEKYVLEVNSSRNGENYAFSYLENDTTEKISLSLFDPASLSDQNIIRNVNSLKKITLDDAGKQLGFLISQDTAKTKTYSLFYWEKSQKKAYSLIDTATVGMVYGWSPSENSNLWFSKDGLRLYFGTAKRPQTEPKDTLLEDEKAVLDVWNWKDDLLQPQQKILLEAEKKFTFLAICYPGSRKFLQLGDTIVRDVVLPWKGQGDYTIGYERKPYLKMYSWDASNYKNIYSINLNTGEKKLIAVKSSAQYNLSPNGKNIVWYNPPDSSWHVTILATGLSQNLSKQLGVNFYYEWNDVPALPTSYGYGGWLKNDNSVLINDHYDIWKFDLSGKSKPVNFTAGEGRKNYTQYRIINLDADEAFIDFSSPVILSGFNENNKEGGFFKLEKDLGSVPIPVVFGKNSYSGLVKSKKETTYIWRKGSFREFNDLWCVTSLNDKPKRLSNANPQQSKYLWGDVRLVEWTSLNKEKLKGLLYTPENMTPDKKYPMLVYFYERNSDGLYLHTIPAPSRSILNRPYCTSNGYVLFVPDITYKQGYPGRSAMDAIVSGCLAMCDQFEFIDKNNMGIQGQSWGGYQVAYLITQTNLFKAAMAGAPVSNMTSAYGGIRWGTGISRMFQYEQEQSRIGGTLWDKTMLYIENSPIFNLPKVNTPLLIMHNDMDGSVPWYQGIELFNALRRLDKPVWMLTYNGEDHNLTKRPNMKDLTVRMMQFFDYYLKGMPQPAWMAEGIPAISKGRIDGYELEK